jgi:hypothetical protein
MGIPLLSENGFLPPGVHSCGLEEMRVRFGRFQGSDQRPRLMARFESFLAEVRAAGIVRAVIINGSFVSGKAAPNDLDLLLVLPGGHDFRADLRPTQYNVLDRNRVRRAYGFDVFVAEDNAADYDALVRFFQRVRLQPDLSKGILRIEL